MVNYKKYLTSRKLLLKLTAIDFITWLSIAGIIGLFSILMELFFKSVLGGKTIEEVQQLAQTSPQLILSLAEKLQGAILISVFIFIILAVGLLLLYSLSRKLLWEQITKDKQSFKKWALLHLVFPIPAIIALLFMLIIRLIYSIIVNLILQLLVSPLGIENVKILQDISGAFIKMIFFLLFFFYMFHLYYDFSRTGKIWQSIGTSFMNYFKSFHKKLLFLLISFIVLVVAVLITMGFDWLLPNEKIQLIITTFFSALYFAWLRISYNKQFNERVSHKKTNA